MFPLGLALLVFTLAGLALLVGFCAFSWLVRPIGRRKEAEETYECGISAEGSNRGIGFAFMHYAVLFLVFDLAGLYLFLYVAAGRMPLEVAGSLALGLCTLGTIIAYATQRRKYHVA